MEYVRVKVDAIRKARARNWRERKHFIRNSPKQIIIDAAKDARISQRCGNSTTTRCPFSSAARNLRFALVTRIWCSILSLFCERGRTSTPVLQQHYCAACEWPG